MHSPCFKLIETLNKSLETEVYYEISENLTEIITAVCAVTNIVNPLVYSNIFEVLHDQLVEDFYITP